MLDFLCLTASTLEGSITLFIEAEKKSKVVTKSSVIYLSEDGLSVTLLPEHDARQLRL
jgi:hypothetical protein